MSETTKKLPSEALDLAIVLRGMVECGSAPDDLWERDQPDGDSFVIRAAELLETQREEIAVLQEIVRNANAREDTWKADVEALRRDAQRLNALGEPSVLERLDFDTDGSWMHADASGHWSYDAAPRRAIDGAMSTGAETGEKEDA